MATVLVVDDEPVVRSLVSEVLERDGHEVFSAEDGVEALSLFRSHEREIDILVSDVVMPGMNGAALAAKLQEERPDLPVLLMSGGSERITIDESFVFLAKPFCISELARRVRTLAESVAPSLAR